MMAYDTKELMMRARNFVLHVELETVYTLYAEPDIAYFNTICELLASNIAASF